MITIVNADTRTVEVRVFYGNDTSCLTDINNYVIHGKDHRVMKTPPNESHSYRIGASYYWKHTDFIRNALTTLAHTKLTGRLPQNHIICLFDTGTDVPNIADYTALLESLRNELVNYSAGTAELKTVLESFQVVMPAIATSLSALGPYGAIPAGVFAAIGGVISIFLTDVSQGTEATVSPPTIREIGSTVELVVDEANYRTDARDATVHIKNAANWLKDRADHFMSDAIRRDPNAEENNSHFIKDFKSDLEILVGQSSDLRSTMAKLKQYPIIAKYVLPAYVVGAWTWLIILRLHDAVRLLEGDKIQRYDIELYNKELSSLIDGLNAAKSALQEFCDVEVKRDNVAPDSIFGQVLSATRMAKYTGVDTTSHYQSNFLPTVGTSLEKNPFLFLDEFVTTLKCHQKNIGLDISKITSDPNAQLTEYLNSGNWYNKAKESTP